MIENKPVEVALSPNASSLYIFFGGIAGAIGLPPFEFYNSSKILDEHKIFVRDFAQSWYQHGLPGLSHDIYSTAGYLQTHIDNLKPARIFFVGNSMGAYGAMLVNEILGYGETIAFAPQTFISPILRLRHRDYRWGKQIFSTYRKSLFKKHIWDIKPVLLRQRKNRKLSIFVSKSSRLDLIHATHIKDIPGVHIYPFEDGGHRLVKLLRDKGVLPAIMLGNYP